jgi:hypothetical protein
MIIDLLIVNHLPLCLKREKPRMSLHTMVQCKFFCCHVAKPRVSKLDGGSLIVGDDLFFVSKLESLEENCVFFTSLCD